MLRIRTVFTGVQGAPYYSNLYFGGNSAAEALDAQTAVANFWSANTALICTPLAYEVEGDVARIDPVTGNITEIIGLANVTGAFTGAGEAAPLASQLLVQLRTGEFINGRELRGRMFIPYLVITIIDDGRVLASAITSVGARVDALIAEGAAAGGLVIYSRTHNTFAPVTIGDVWQDLAVLRSRRD